MKNIYVITGNDSYKKVANIKDNPDVLKEDHRIYYAKTSYQKSARLFINSRKSVKVVSEDNGGCEANGQKYNYKQITYMYNSTYLKPGCKENSDNPQDYGMGCSTSVPYLVTIERDRCFVKVQIDIKVVQSYYRNQLLRIEERNMEGFTFNCETGQTYFLPPVKIQTGKPLEIVQRKPIRIGMHGYTSISSPELERLPKEIIMEIARNILEVKAEILGFKPSVYMANMSNLDFLLSVNHDPLCNIMMILAKKEYAKHWYDLHHNSINQVEEYITYLGLNKSKALNKLLFREGPESLIYYKLIKETDYFKDNQNIVKLAEEICKMNAHGTTFDSLLDLFYPGCNLKLIKGQIYNIHYAKLEKYRLCADAPVIKDLFRIYNGNESLVVNKLLKSDSRWTRDTVDTLYMIKDLAEKNAIKYRRKSCPFKNKTAALNYIDKMLVKDYSKMHHDQVASIWNLLSYKNEKISYTKAEKSLNFEDEGYIFNLPKDTLTLKNIGLEMNICVGSYGNRALSKKCTIINVTKNGKNIVCIELYKGKVCQVKLTNNRLIDDKIPELKDAVYKWIIKNNLDARYCRDFTVKTFKNKGGNSRLLVSEMKARFFLQ